MTNLSILTPPLLHALDRFSADNPSYELRVDLSTRPVHEKLLQDEADAVITTGNIVKPLHNLSALTLFESKPVLLCRR